MNDLNYLGGWPLDSSSEPKDVEVAEKKVNTEEPQTQSEQHFPESLPILPLRGLVVYPQTAVPLTIGQQRSINLVDSVASRDRLIGLIGSKDLELDTPAPEDLYRIGTIAMIHRLFRAPDGTIRLLVQGLARFRTMDFISIEPFLTAKVEYIPEVEETGLEIEALAQSARNQFTHISDMIPSIPRELVNSINSIQAPLLTAYTIANFQRMDISDAQQILEIDSTSEKLRKLVGILTRESEVLDLGQKIQDEAKSEIDKVQREYFLREQIKAMQKELGEGFDQEAEIEEIRRKIIEARMPAEAEQQANRELDRLARMPAASGEYSVIRTYLDWLISLPWSKSTVDNLDLAHARSILDTDHYGLMDIKDRILEFLAVRKLRLEKAISGNEPEITDAIRKEREGIIICFVGPPGVGKTSLGQSIAHALDRKFIRASLGGIRDEAEIRGHRRTYIGALPGRIIQSLRRVESNNPVFMLDEIDKLTMDFHGDPASALLEVLDPEQNNEFRDNYLEVAFNLSQVMFITTANTLETIPGPLLDRMEVIHLSGYTEEEKTSIASLYLIPRQLRENGLNTGELNFTDDAIKTLIRYYTREAGVRNLERQIGQVCRKLVTRREENKGFTDTVTSEVVKDCLGRYRFLGNDEISRRTAMPGVATGLAWTPAGGDILFIEATKMPGSKGFMITGSVGKVMEESARAALSYIRSKSSILNIPEEFFDKMDIHLHIPAGAQPKDGPSAGVTIVTALVSLLAGKPVPPDIGMTGEITLTGQVLPVGGIKEKVLAAHRAGIQKIILPRLNQADLEDVPDEVKNSMEFHFADDMLDFLNIILFQENIKSGKAGGGQ